MGGLGRRTGVHGRGDDGGADTDVAGQLGRELHLRVLGTSSRSAGHGAHERDVRREEFEKVRRARVGGGARRAARSGTHLGRAEVDVTGVEDDIIVGVAHACGLG